MPAVNGPNGISYVMPEGVLFPPTVDFESQLTPSDYIMDDSINLLVAKTKPKKVESTPPKNWLEQLLRDMYGLPTPPKQEPKFLESFVVSNNLGFKNPEFPFCDPKMHVGIEVEVENVSYINPNIPVGFWQITEDGSLRNHGKEFKTFAIPVKYAQQALEQLYSGLNPDIDFSHRTSIHVHVDVRGLTIEQILIMIFVYAAIENLLFKFAGASRRNSIFCTPITETQLLCDLNIKDRNSFRSHVQGVWQKYSALNILPLSTFGTLEFRQMPGTADITKLCIWLELLSRIRLFAYRNKLDDVLKTIGDLNTNSQYRKFVESIFGNITGYLDTTSLMVDMEKAVYMCKNCTAINKFHQDTIAAWEATSMLAIKFPKTMPLSTILSKDTYFMFLDIYNNYGSGTTEQEFYKGIRIQLNAYIKAYPNYAELFQFIKANPL